MVHFNYGYALFLAGKYTKPPSTSVPVITSDQQDGQAYFLFSKSLAKLGNTEAATAADDMARRYLRTAYAKWETEWQKSQTTSGVNLRMRDVLNREEVFGLDREQRSLALRVRRVRPRRICLSKRAIFIRPVATTKRYPNSIAS